MDKPGHTPANTPPRAYMHVSYVVASVTVPARVTREVANARGRKVAKAKEPKAKVKAKASIELSRRATMHGIHPPVSPNSICKQHLLPQ